jgi:hypothetical protein
MDAAKTGDAVSFLDLLLDYFADGSAWTRGDLEDRQGRRCLVGAIHYLRREHQLSSRAAEDLLQHALPPGHCHLALFNDRCAHIAELRALILGARVLALAAAEDRPRRAETARPRRWWSLIRLRHARRAPTAAGDDRRASEGERLAA